ncbi:hypothetical protein SADUNF_Sadunf16G0019300 [Salix dunnii]|uniref:Pentatricopeptide repeat-containing protein n=1 Tax=Salix dunnii TaxID=1413687 RepID=A0A835J4K3_9ROSI|nr:hypothetical protein SADUNF_Sadunf16G0019300 [Salix dunnii]
MSKLCREVARQRCLSNVVCLSYFDYSKYDLGRKAFDKMRKRDVTSWNTMISCEYVNDLFVMSMAIFMFAWLGCVDIARKNDFLVQDNDLFLQAVETEQMVLNEVTFLLSLLAVSQFQCLDLVHTFAIKNLAVLNAVIVMYSSDVVLEIFVISAFVQNGMDDEGLMLVYEMLRQWFEIDLVTDTVVLSAASNLRNQEIGKQTHAYLLRHEIHFEGIDGYAIDMCAKCGLIRIAP